MNIKQFLIKNRPAIVIIGTIGLAMLVYEISEYYMLDPVLISIAVTAAAIIPIVIYSIFLFTQIKK